MRFVDVEKGVPDVAAALEGARWILVERAAEDAELIGSLRQLLWDHGEWTSTVVPGKEEEGVKFSDYFHASEPLRRVPSHRALALFRGRHGGHPAAERGPAAGGRGHQPRGAGASHRQVPGGGEPQASRRRVAHRDGPPGVEVQDPDSPRARRRTETPR